MIKYKKIVAKNGKEMFYKNGTLTKVGTIPTSILNNLEDGVELSVGTPNPETVDETHEDAPKLHPKDNVCIFCGEPSTRTRFLNMNTIYLCDEDYTNNTTGKIVAQFNRVNQ